MEFVVDRGNIAKRSADALVNAAGTNLLMDTGAVGSELMKEAGPEINEAAVEQGPVELGEVVYTDAFGLDAKYVIHAAAAHFGGDSSGEHIRGATRNTLRTADDLGCESLVLPAIGCGGANYPIEDGGRIICEELVNYDPETLADVTLIAYTSHEYDVLSSVAEDSRGD